MPDRYVIVPADDTDKRIIAGPLLWDGDTEYDPGDGRKLMLEADALAADYAWDIERI